MGRLLRHYPVTLALLVLQLVQWWATARDPALFDTWLGWFGVAWPDLAAGEVWRPLTAPLLAAYAGFVRTNMILLVLVLPVAERRFGSVNVLVVFFLGSAFSAVTVAAGLALAGEQGSEWAAEVARQRDSGLSAGAWSLVAALAWSVPRLWLRVAAVLAVFAFLGRYYVEDPTKANLLHLVSVSAVTVALALRTAFGAPPLRRSGAAGQRVREPSDPSARPPER